MFTRSIQRFALLSLIFLTGYAWAQVPQQVELKVWESYSHQRDGFTQGLLWHEGELYESTGLYGKSSLRRVDLETGEVLQMESVDASYFAEGLELVNDRLYQLTWKAGVVLVYDRESFQQIDQLTYEGEGWGLAYDGESLIMSNGTPILTFRDPATFAPVRQVVVRANGNAIKFLNELEYVDGFVYANVWQTHSIIKIDPRSGHVVAVVDAPNLLSEEERKGVDVLNGIAWNPEKERFYITGKLWPKLFEVTFEDPALSIQADDSPTTPSTTSSE